jgi:hypothetical protein
LHIFFFCDILCETVKNGQEEDMNRRFIKASIELAETATEADAILSKEFASFPEKYAFLRGMFDFSIIGRTGSGDVLENDYWAVLSAIVNQKWRG